MQSKKRYSCSVGALACSLVAARAISVSIRALDFALLLRSEFLMTSQLDQLQRISGGFPPFSLLTASDLPGFLIAGMAYSEIMVDLHHECASVTVLVCISVARVLDCVGGVLCYKK